MSERNNSGASFYVNIHGMQPGAVTLRRDAAGHGLFIDLDPDKRVSIRIDLRPGFDDWEQSRQGLEELATAALAAAQQLAELQADAAYVAEHGNDDLETGHLRDPKGDEAAHG